MATRSGSLTARAALDVVSSWRMMAFFSVRVGRAVQSRCLLRGGAWSAVALRATSAMASLLCSRLPMTVAARASVPRSERCSDRCCWFARLRDERDPTIIKRNEMLSFDAARSNPPSLTSGKRLVHLSLFHSFISLLASLPFSFTPLSSFFSHFLKSPVYPSAAPWFSHSFFLLVSSLLALLFFHPHAFFPFSSFFLSSSLWCLTVFSSDLTVMSLSFTFFSC